MGAVHAYFHLSLSTPMRPEDGDSVQSTVAAENFGLCIRARPDNKAKLAGLCSNVNEKDALLPYYLF